ncbi:MAG: hypothetical protein D6731_12010 [Planctomycetota bacterium]|nr:MAG: hypothetical protein D6731_12010 [Planctomycetota bacterium]
MVWVDWVLAVGVALYASPVAAQWVERLREVTPRGADAARLLERPLSQAELALLTEICLLEPEARAKALGELPTEALLRWHVRLEAMPHGERPIFFESGNPADSLRAKGRTVAELLAAEGGARSELLGVLREVLVRELVWRPISLQEAEPLRRWAVEHRYAGIHDLVLDALLGLPSVRDWSEKEGGVRGRAESERLEDPVRSGAWIGLSPEYLQTPYRVFEELIRALNLPAGSTVADMGTAYGRMGFVVGERFPELRFVGYEYLEHRVAPAAASARALGYSNVRFLQADFSAPDFRPVAADVYFTYWSNRNRSVMEALFDRLLEEARRRPEIRIVTSDFDPARAVGADWLVRGERIEVEVGARPRVLDVYRVDPEKLKRARTRAERERAFAAARPAATTAPPRAPLSEAVAREVFDAIRASAIADARRRAAESEGPEREAHRRAASDLARSQLVVLPREGILARGEGERVFVSRGLLDELARQAEGSPETLDPRRMLAVVLGHELAHAAGQRSERAADARGLAYVRGSSLGLGEDAELKRTLDAFLRPTGASHLDATVWRLRHLLRYGSARGRLEALRRAARGQPDPLERYRRADGTLRWAPLLGERALAEVGGAAHFGLALFLKELALVARTGDRARIEEFFDGLAQTDFYVHYGLFVVGARAGEVAYARYLQELVKPRFVQGILRTNAALAAGIALPMLWEGGFEGRAFAVSLGSLGLSAAAVRAGLRSVEWVVSLREAREGGLLGSLAGSRLARLGGWFYTAAELAVVLLAADDLSAWLNERLDEREAKERLAAAGEAFARAVIDPEATSEAVAEAAARHHRAWAEYRDFLYRPLFREDASFAARLERLARSAKLGADARRTARERVAKHPFLKRHLDGEHGSVADYARRLEERRTLALQTELERLLRDREAQRAGLLRAVYSEGLREDSLLAGSELPALLRSAFRRRADLTGGSPRSDVFARLGEERRGEALRAELRRVYRRAARNRLQAYADEAALLEAAGSALRVGGRGEIAAVLDAERRRVEGLRDAERRLFADYVGRKGVAEALRGTKAR